MTLSLDRLQWGRDQLIAELPSSLAMSLAVWFSFNGAAIS